MELNQHIREFAQSFPHIIWATDPHGVMEFVNDYGMKYLGFEGKVISPEEWARTVHPDDISNITEKWMYALQNKLPFNNKQLQRNAKGEYEWYNVSAKPLLDKEGNIIKWLGISININHEEQLTGELKDLNERLNLIIQATNSGTWDWDVEKDTTEHNDHWFEMLGYKPGDIKTDLRSWLNMIHAEDRDKARQLLNDHVEGKSEYYESIFRIKKKDGDWKWIYDSGKAIRRDEDGKALRFVGMQLDYDNRKKSHDIDVENDRKMRLLASSAHSLLEIKSIKDIHNHVVEMLYEYIKEQGIVVLTEYQNNMLNWEILTTKGIPDLVDKVTKTLGRPIEGLSGRSTDYITSEMITGKLRKFKPQIEETLTGSIKNLVINRVTKMLRLDEIFSIGMVKNNVVYGSISIIQKDKDLDLDYQFVETLVYQAASAIERTHAEQELLDQNKTLTELNQEFDLVIQGLSHDLKSPIHTARGILEMHSLDPDEMPMADLIDQFNKSLNKLDLITNDLLGIVSNNRSDIEIEEINLKTLIEDAITEQEDIFIFKQISWKKNIKQKAPFHSDNKRLKMIIRNLLSNAIKYQDAKKEEKWIEIKASSDKEKCIVSVSDNGIGMRKEQLEKIFDIFYRGDYSREGIGLGLNIIKQTLEKLGGDIKVSSEHREGSSFSITIPNIKP